MAASAAIATGAQAVTVINGSFELGAPITGGSDFLPTGDTTSLPGWRVLSSGVDYVDNTLWDAANGSRSVELSGTGSGGLVQRLGGFTVGEKYRLRFKLSANPFGPNRVYRTTVSVTGGTAQQFAYTKTAANTPTNMLYEFQEYVWTATNAFQNFQFRSVGAGQYGSVLDSVSISLVPEPSSWMLLIAGFGMTGFAMRRRRMGSVAA
nr:PEPxxWA-CTERM sorting domain-containing protein [Polymorphobacter sp.]